MNKNNLIYIFLFIFFISYPNIEINNDIGVTVHVNKELSPETFRDLLEGTTNFVFFESTWDIYDDRVVGGTSEYYRKYELNTPYLRGDTYLNDYDKLHLIKYLKLLIAKYFSNSSKSINGKIHYINNANNYISKYLSFENSRTNSCRSVLLYFDDSSIEFSLTNKARNLSVKNLKLNIRDCNNKTHSVTIPTINTYRSRKGLNFIWTNAVTKAMDMLIVPMNLDPKFYYNTFTPKKERRYIKLNGLDLNKDKVLAEEELKKYIGKRKKSFEGIYEVNSPAANRNAKYKIAIVELPSSYTWDSQESSTIYAGIYISGATEDKEQWSIGDIKFYFRSTIKENYYEMKYYMANKSLNSNTALKFGYLTSDNTIWRTDNPTSSYFQGAFISVSREDNSKYFKDDYWIRKYPYNAKPGKSKPKSKPSRPTYKSKSKSEPPRKGVKIG